MAEKNKIWTVLAVLALGGGIYYLWRKSQGAQAAAAAPALLPGIVPEMPQPASSPATIAPAPALQTSPGPMTAQAPAPVTTAGSAEINTVKDFFASNLDAANLSQFNLSYPLFSQTEWDGLFDLVVNDWEGGGGNTAQRTEFWNTWRTKYHINDGTYE